MKIICDACSAKYSIADEKVRGKVFKIRCKKCSNVILVRGDEPEPAPMEAQAPAATTVSPRPAGIADEWYVVINQEQVGPLAPSQVREKIEQGEINGDTFAWKEGMADWVGLSTLSEFKDATDAAVAAAEAAAAADAFTQGTVDRPADDLAAAGAASADAVADAVPAAGAREPSDSGMFSTSAASTSNGEQRLTGERNENSVLFSLNNLSALASDKPKAAASSGGAAPAPGHAQAGGQEGSGLIDIQSMAQVYLGGQSAAAPAGTADDIPVFSSTNNFNQPSPVLMPQVAASSNEGNKKMMYALFALIGLIAIVGVVLVMMLMGGDDEDKKTVAKNDISSAAAADDDGSDSSEPADDKDEKQEASSSVAAMASSAASEVASSESSTVEDKASSRRSSKSSKKSRSSKKSSKKSSRKSSSRKTSTKCDEVSCLLADNPKPSCCKKYSGGGSGGTSGGSSLKDQLDKSDIRSGMSRVSGKAKACGKRHSAKGRVKISVKVAPSGRVSSTSVRSSPSPALGSCVARAAKSAKFKRTKRGRTFTYPFVF